MQCPCAGITFTRAQIFFIAHCDIQVSADRRERERRSSDQKRDKVWKMEEEKGGPKKDREVRPRHLTKHKSAIIKIHSRLAQPKCHSSFVQCPCAGITFTRAQIFFIAHCDIQVSVDRRERERRAIKRGIRCGRWRRKKEGQRKTGKLDPGILPNTNLLS